MVGYQGLVEVGRGATGVMYRARDGRRDRDVAVKVLRIFDVDPARWQSFEQSRRRLMQAGEHPNIVSTYSMGITGEGQPYIAMEFAPGASLHTRLKAGEPMDWTAGAHVGLGMAEALVFAHGCGVVHGGIKPKNVLIGTDASIKLTDFAVGVLVEDISDSLLRPSPVSVVHAAPERLDGHLPDERSDLYALGSTLYTALVGRAPFVPEDGTTLALLVERIMSGAAPDLSTVPGPPELREVVGTLLARQPEDRPSSASEVAAVLRRIHSAGPPATSGDARRTVSIDSGAIPDPPAWLRDEVASANAAPPRAGADQTVPRGSHLLPPVPPSEAERAESDEPAASMTVDRPSRDDVEITLGETRPLG